METLIELLRSFPPYVAASTNLGVTYWGAIGVVLAIPIELIVRGGSSYRGSVWWKMVLAVLARLVVGFVAFTSAIGWFLSVSLFAFFAGIISYIGTVWVVRIMVAGEIFLKVLIDLGRKARSKDGEGGGDLAAPELDGNVVAGGAPRRIGWRDILSV